MDLAADFGHAATVDSAAQGRATLRNLFHLRNVVTAGTSCILLVAANVYGLALPLAELLAGLAALLGFNLYTWRRWHQPVPVSDAEVLLQVTFDLLAFTYLLYFTDGTHNPFQGVLLVPLTITAAYLRPRYALLMLALGAGSYTLLHFGDLPVQTANGSAVPKALRDAAVYLSDLVTAALIAFFVARIGMTVRAHTAALARAREQHLNDHFIVGFGALAAGAAHEMATPLSVMSVLVKELKAGRGDPGEGLAIIGSQVEACKQTLRSLSETASHSRLQGRGAMAVDTFLETVGDKFRLLRPGIRLRLSWDGPTPGPAVHPDPALTQSLVSLLNNAADASPQAVELRGYLYGDSLRVEVADRGKGMPREVAQRIGSPFVTSKGPGGGMGIGLFLTDSTVSRLGGTLRFRERPEGGTRVEVSLPLAVLRAA